MIDLVKLILKEMGSDLAPDIQNNAGDEIPHQYLSAARAREVLGWRPKFTLEEGLRKTIVWYRELFGINTAGAAAA